MIWRRKPTVPQDALLLDAEFQIMLSELRYPSIYKLHASSVGRSPRTAPPPTFHRPAEESRSPDQDHPPMSVPRAALQSLIHSGLFQAASAFRKTFSRRGRNFRFE
jgi:hypothetical protein